MNTHQSQTFLRWMLYTLPLTALLSLKFDNSARPVINTPTDSINHKELTFDGLNMTFHKHAADGTDIVFESDIDLKAGKIKELDSATVESLKALSPIEP